ncbi:unannotated protein [freshwater metagenome]|uniref:Unannotated protein n=1 Tax=freshwater metagenome TaxID=449393 RepID=A0A6J7SFS2_9ZZZZ
MILGIIPAFKAGSNLRASVTEISLIKEFSSGQFSYKPGTSVKNRANSAFNAPAIAPAAISAFTFNGTPDLS